ncbi:nicalin-1 [Gymnodraco acuticeps]|uniref:Nicalin-1 n=1 Tax=Gymnodraco acuticeps TaxID=8218 RepID=A0A6P8TC53_GYMAC|nr:nicalin-1 [Gymnodraco acuticeps]
MFEEASEVFDNMFKSSFPLTFIVFIPAVLILVSPLPADAAHEFTVYRMQQYDLQGQPYGTRNAILNTEARTVEAEVLSRRCVIMRLADFSYEEYQKALRQSAGAVVIILPKNMSAMPQDIVQQFMELEPEMLATETVVPVYFAMEDDELLSIYTQTLTSSSSQGSLSAAEVLLHTATANGFQMVTSGAQSKAISDWAITSLEGRLAGVGGEDLPTIVVVAHYDSFGVAPVCSPLSVGFGYSLSLTRCLFRKSTGSVHNAYKRGCQRASSPDVKFSMVHKKINLADDMLAWEHERFGIRRLPAFTLSHLASHRLAQRASIMDARSVSPSSRHGAGEPPAGPHVDVQKLSRNTKLVAEALARVIYNLTEKGAPGDLQIFTEQMVQDEQLSAVVDWLTAQPRAAQLVDKDSSVVSTLEYHMGHYLKDVKRHYVRADKRDPEFVFYDQLKQTMNAYRVKPAIFDLLLAVCISGYLGVMYLAIQNFGLLYSVARRVTQPKVKSH